MAARPADATSARPSPRPRQDPLGVSGTGLARPDQAAGQLVATAGGAVVTAARVGRLLGRAGWRMAKQLPGVSLVEHQAQRLRETARVELLRLLEMPQNLFGTAGPEEQRVMMLVQNANSDPAPLRTAMTELLSRAGETKTGRSREYLFGAIVSQLVPDEARMLSALAQGTRYAVVDVAAKHVGRSTTRTVLANASLIGAAAGVAPARNASTYLTRLHQFGLVEFGPAVDELSEEYDQLAVDGTVQEARAMIDRNKMGSVRLLRKSVALSTLGQDFWAACMPQHR